MYSKIKLGVLFFYLFALCISAQKTDKSYLSEKCVINIEYRNKENKNDKEVKAKIELSKKELIIFFEKPVQTGNPNLKIYNETIPLNEISNLQLKNKSLSFTAYKIREYKIVTPNAEKIMKKINDFQKEIS